MSLNESSDPRRIIHARVASRCEIRAAAGCVAEDGTAIALDILTDVWFGFLLEPKTFVGPGAYHVEYSDTCSDAPAFRNVVFSTAPQIQETRAPLDVSNEPSNCTLPPRPSEGGTVFVKKTTVDFNCRHCDVGTDSPDADVALDGGAGEASHDGAASVPTSPGATSSGNGEGCNCSTRAREPSTWLTTWLTGLATFVLVLRRKGSSSA